MSETCASSVPPIRILSMNVSVQVSSRGAMVRACDFSVEPSDDDEDKNDFILELYSDLVSANKQISTAFEQVTLIVTELKKRNSWGSC